MGDLDQPKVCTATVPVARIEHKCCECGRTISPGTQYYHLKALWDDSWGTFKWCNQCDAVMGAIDHEFEFGRLVEYAADAEMIDEESLQELQELGDRLVQEDGDGRRI